MAETEKSGCEFFSLFRVLEKGIKSNLVTGDYITVAFEFNGYLAINGNCFQGRVRITTWQSLVIDKMQAGFSQRLYVLRG